METRGLVPGVSSVQFTGGFSALVVVGVSTLVCLQSDCFYWPSGCITAGRGF